MDRADPGLASDAPPFWENICFIRESIIDAMAMLKIQEEFFKKLSSPSGVEKLFEFIPGVNFWIKDKAGRYMAFNQADLHKLGAAREKELIAKTDFELFPKPLAEGFTADDEAIMQSQKPQVNKIELVTNEDGSISWHSTTKTPLFGKDGTVIGTAGTTMPLDNASSLPQVYQEMSNVIEYIKEHYTEPIEVKKLADLTFSSLSNFNKKFKKLFQLSPKEFVNKYRIQAACRLICQSRENVADIAWKLGYFDQSHFTRQFRKFIGITPTEYRNNYQKGLK